MLRHYDKIGLLKPSYIKDNGYRYYRDEAIHKISVIKQLRRFEFSLEEIDKIMCKNDSAYTKKMLQLKVDHLQQSATEYNYLIIEMEKQMRAIKGNDKILNTTSSFDILIGHRGDFLALCQRKRTNEEEIDDMIDELFVIISNSKDMVPTGTHMTIFHQSYNTYDPEDTDVEVCIPVNTEFNEGVYYTRIIEGGLYISTIYIGSYDMIGNAYLALIKWAKQNNYSIIGPTVERYYKDIRASNSQDEYITEICIPVKHH